MVRKILVTGATGSAGGEVVKWLAENGESVKAAARSIEKAKAKNWKNVEIARFDYEKPETWKEAFANVDRVFLVAPPGHPALAKLLIPAVDKARKIGVRHIVMLSAMGVEQNEKTPLRVVERHIEEAGMPYTLLRPNGFMQNFSGRLREGIMSRGAIFLPAGDSKTSFVDCRDIAAVASLAFTDNRHRYKAYTLTGPHALTHFDAAAILSKAAGREIHYIPVSDDAFRKASKEAGLPAESVEMTIGFYHMVRQGWAAAVSPDMPRLLGRPPLPFERFANDYAESWK
jgi:uncharacterized protein YbjT (DUF2867 family)